MEFSLLIAESDDGGYQPVEMVSSESEAREAIENYMRVGPNADWLAPVRFVLFSRAAEGGYTTRRELAL